MSHHRIEAIEFSVVFASIQSKSLSFDFSKAVNYSSDSFTSVQLVECFLEKRAVLYHLSC